MIWTLSPRYAGFLGFFGALSFIVALAILHTVRTDIDWATHYVSDFANEPFGWMLTLASLLHGFGNLALAVGLRNALTSSPLQTWAVVLFTIAGAGFIVAAVFPTDPIGTSLSAIGLIHQMAVSLSFGFELAALYLFSAEFTQDIAWRSYARHSFILATVAATGLSFFVMLLMLGQMPGLGERVALAGFLAWEIWISFRLIRYAQSA